MECFKEDPKISHQRFKGALYLMSAESRYFLYSWKDLVVLGPALVRAQHSDKESIVEMLKDFSIKSNRSYTEFCFYQLPVRAPRVTGALVKAAKAIAGGEGMDVDGEVI